MLKTTEFTSFIIFCFFPSSLLVSRYKCPLNTQEAQSSAPKGFIIVRVL